METDKNRKCSASSGGFIGYAFEVPGRVRKMLGKLGSLETVRRASLLGMVLVGFSACQADNPAFDERAVRTGESTQSTDSTNSQTPVLYSESSATTPTSGAGTSSPVNPFCGPEHGPCYLMKPQSPQADSIPDLGGGGAHLVDPVKVEFSEHQAEPPLDHTLDIQGSGGQMKASSVSLPEGGRYGVEVWVRGPRCGDDDDRCGLVNLEGVMAISFRDNRRVYCRISGVGTTLTIRLPSTPEVYKVACWSDGAQARLWVSGHEEVVRFDLSASDPPLPSNADTLVVGGPGHGSDDVSHLSDGSFALVRVWKKAQDLAAYVQKNQGQ